jgi:hypothetical protein
MRGATPCIKDRPRWKIVPGAAPAALIHVNCPGAEMRFFSALGGNYNAQRESMSSLEHEFGEPKDFVAQKTILSDGHGYRKSQTANQ